MNPTDEARLDWSEYDPRECDGFEDDMNGDEIDPWTPGSGGAITIRPVPPPPPVAIDRRLIEAFVEWCDATGEHEGRDWEGLVEILRGTL